MNSNTKLVCAFVFLCACSGVLFAQGPCGGKPCGGDTTTPAPTRRPPAAKPKSTTKTSPPIAKVADPRPVTGPFPKLAANVSQAPLTAIDGRKFKLADYGGKVLVVNLWATWCGPCILEVPELVKLHRLYKSRGVVLVGLSTETPDDAAELVRDFIRNHKVSYRMAWAPTDVALTLMQGRDAIPQTFVISRDGRVMKRFIGFNPTRNPPLLRQAIEDALNYKPELREDSTSPGSVPTTAELTIRTTPANTLILINGQNVGVTGEDGVLNLPTLKPGEHVIVARRDRYRDAQRTVVLEANQSQVVELDLSPMTGTLDVNVNPGDAQIEIEGHGSYADKVSDLELAAGRYSIAASKPGYETIRKTVEIVPGLRVDETLVLEPAGTANPQLAFAGREDFFSNGQNYTRYKLTVTNSAAFAQDMFASSPDLPPCGLNSKSSRTWVDIYDGRGVRLGSFCALSKPNDLSSIWFALPAQLSPPSVFVVLNDRLKGKEYKSNLVAIP